MSGIIRTRKNFVWTEEAILVLINLYGRNIDDFQNPLKVQCRLWKNLVETMKNDTSLPQNLRDGLTVSIAQRKWITLQKNFKSAFYSSNDNTLFPFYEKMSQMFNDYAKKHLNESNSMISGDANNQTTQEQVSAFVMSMLDDEISLLRGQSSEENQQKVPSTDKPSETSKMIRALKNIPKDSISVQKATMKIVPNTPFNRRYQLSTILNQRDAVNALKRNGETRTKEFMIKKQRPSTVTSLNDISDIKNDEMNESFEYEVEALNECNLKDLYDPDVKRVKNSNKICRSSLELYTEPEVLLESQSVDVEATITTEPTSVLEVPSANFEYIDESREVQTTRIVPKKLIWNETSSGDCENEEKPPAWFEKFLTQYNADQEKIEGRLGEISEKLNKVLVQRPSNVRLSNIKVKRES